ncbi:MAG: ABC transporter substrate-binding protein [Cellvibrionales bacterium]|nr:ABC transporter substrate-binding protein [Cellvibrionales bacterium]
MPHRPHSLALTVLCAALASGPLFAATPPATKPATKPTTTPTATKPTEKPYPATAHQTIEQVSTALLAAVPALAERYESQPQDFYQGIEQIVAPWIDFDSFYKGVMGRQHYSAANPQQRANFKQALRQDLIETYGKALLRVTADTRYEVVPPKTEEPKPGKPVWVKQRLFTATGRIEVLYRMHRRTAAGRWQLRDALLDGISMGKTFRSQFARSAQENAGDLDQVIAKWDSAD